MSPFFIGGWKSGRQTSPFGSPTRCSHCGQLTQLLRYDDSTHATAFFVPVFKLSSSTGVVCSRCGAPASAADIDGALEAARVERAKSMAARDYSSEPPETLSGMLHAVLEGVTWGLEDAADGIEPGQAARSAAVAQQQAAELARQREEARERDLRKKIEKTHGARTRGKLRKRLSGLLLWRGDASVAGWADQLSAQLAAHGYVETKRCRDEAHLGMRAPVSLLFTCGGTEFAVHLLDTPERAHRLKEEFMAQPAMVEAFRNSQVRSTVFRRTMLMAYDTNGVEPSDFASWIAATMHVNPPQ